MVFKKHTLWYKFHRKLYSFIIRRYFGSFGEGSIIDPPFQSFDLANVHLGKNCRISGNCWLQSFSSRREQKFDSRLDIGDNTYIGRFCHIMACMHMQIGNNVMIAERVYISDNLHGFEDVNMPISVQPLKTPGQVIIEDEVWLGDGVCVMPNVRIGKHSVIGANSVVTKNIPSYSVAVGVPAKVIRLYDEKSKQWRKTT